MSERPPPDDSDDAPAELLLNNATDPVVSTLADAIDPVVSVFGFAANKPAEKAFIPFIKKPSLLNTLFTLLIYIKTICF